MRDLFRALEREGVRQRIFDGRKALLMVLAALRALADEPDIVRQTLKEGDAARAKGDLAVAVNSYNRAIEADPKCTEAWHGRGLAKRQQGDRKGALADLDQAVTLEPSAAGLHNDLGLAKADSGDFAGAIASYDAALRLAPDAALTWNNRSFAKRLNGDADAALKDATMALQLNPNYARAYLNRGLCLYNLREWEDALADLEKSVELEKEGQDFTRLRIWVLKARLGKREEADKELRGWMQGRKPGGDRVEVYAKVLLGDVKNPETLELGTIKDHMERFELVELSELRFFAGTKALLEGRDEDARLRFQAALDTGVKSTEVIRSAEAELEGLRNPREK